MLHEGLNIIFLSASEISFKYALLQIKHHLELFHPVVFAGRFWLQNAIKHKTASNKSNTQRKTVISKVPQVLWHYDWTVATMADVDTVTAEISGSGVGTLTSLTAVTADSDADAEPLLLTETDSSSIGVYITTTEQWACQLHLTVIEL